MLWSWLTLQISATESIWGPVQNVLGCLNFFEKEIVAHSSIVNVDYVSLR